jgi:hypothetical protein
VRGVTVFGTELADLTVGGDSGNSSGTRVIYRYPAQGYVEVTSTSTTPAM